MQVVTESLLELGCDKKGEVNEEQLILLGLDLSNKEDYITLSLGKELSDARAELFVLLKDIKAKTSRKTLISNYKALQKFRKNDVTDEVQKTLEVLAPPVDGAITIYCDGGCTPNPGKAGSGVAIYRDERLSELWYGLYEPMGTNNTAELGALYASLVIAQRELQSGNEVSIKCDSMYSIDCISKWAISWERKGWTKKGGEIKNLEIIKKAYYLYNEIKQGVKLSHIKAHAGYEGNELADRMTMYAIDKKSATFVKYTDTIDIAALLKMRAG
ncbi:MAG: ribonuclease H [Sulfurimonas sp.]|nr:MAG: ribonuclease H [Sulfurimonas sp.]